MMETMNRDGVIIDASDRWLDRMGYQRDEMVGHLCTKYLVLEEQRDSIERVQKDIWEKGMVLLTPRKYVTKSGKLIECENSSIALKNEDGEYDRFLTIIVDVTTRNRAQADLAAKNAELEQVNEQLRQFAYIASHDMQEPLRKIRIFGDQLTAEMGDEPSEDARYALDRMKSAAVRLSNLVSDVLALSQAAYADISLQEINLEQLIGCVVSDLDPVMAEKSATLEIESLPAVLGDFRQLRRVFQNILANALKYHPEGTAPYIKISCEIGKADNDTIIAIEDSGIGFDKDCAEQIFQAFHRLHPQSKYNGSGIGLAIVKTVIERHGWHVRADSEGGTGATFLISIPSWAISDLMSKSTLPELDMG